MQPRYCVFDFNAAAQRRSIQSAPPIGSISASYSALSSESRGNRPSSVTLLTVSSSPLRLRPLFLPSSTAVSDTRRISRLAPPPALPSPHPPRPAPAPAHPTPDPAHRSLHDCAGDDAALAVVAAPAGKLDTWRGFADAAACAAAAGRDGAGGYGGCWGHCCGCESVGGCYGFVVACFMCRFVRIVTSGERVDWSFDRRLFLESG